MQAPANTYEESMNESELSFLKKKEEKEKRVFIRTVRNLSVLFIIIPCCLGIIMESLKRREDTAAMAALREEDPYVYLYYFFGMLFLLLLVAVGSFISYNRTLKRLLKDIRRGKKTVEQTIVSRKQFIESNNTYHFYLNSTFRLSIEVSKEDYENYAEGDEINIEYSSYSKNYFGYF